MSGLPDPSPALYLRTLVHLSPLQAICRPLSWSLRRPTSFPDVRVRAIPLESESVATPEKATTLLDQTRVSVLGQEVGLWEPGRHGELMSYNLHYFDWLFGSEVVRPDVQVGLMRRWIEEHPFPSKPAWSPYPTSLRVSNWIRWFLLHPQLAHIDLVSSLAAQVSCVDRNIEWHLSGNHLFANAKALVLGGLWIDTGKGQDWYRKGISLLRKELKRQFGPSGGHGELSPMYQAILVEDLLDVAAVHRRMGCAVPPFLGEAIPQMLDWLFGVMHPDGTLAKLNDCAEGPASDPRGLQLYARTLGVDGKERPGPLPGSWDGYLSALVGDAYLVVDAAPLAQRHLGGHAHADSLSFEVSLLGEKLFVNSGTSTYELGERRQLERSTAGHNTVEIDDCDSSEVWSSFRTGRRARVYDSFCVTSPNGWEARASHDGYRFLRGRPVHSRRWRCHSSGLTVFDMVGGHGEHSLTCRLHLGPAASVQRLEGASVVLATSHASVRIGQEGWGAPKVGAYLYGEGFGRTARAQVIEWHVRAQLPHTARLQIEWERRDRESPS